MKLWQSCHAGYGKQAVMRQDMNRIYTVEVIEKLNDNQRSIAAVFLDYQAAITYCAIFAEKNGYSEEMVEFEVKEWIPGEMDNLRMIENWCKYIGGNGDNSMINNKCDHGGDSDSCRPCEEMVDAHCGEISKKQGSADQQH